MDGTNCANFDNYSNSPLTEQQIRERVGKWVWYESNMLRGWRKIDEIGFQDDDPSKGYPETIYFDGYDDEKMDYLGKTFNLYDHQKGD